jgi:hypothetical protein
LEQLATHRDYLNLCVKRFWRRPRVLILFVAAFASLAGSPALAVAQAPDAATSLGSVKLATVAAIPAPKLIPVPSIYTANQALNSLSIFPVGSNGNVPSLFTQSLLSEPRGVAYWKGNWYIVNSSSDAITVYPANATGRPNPVFTIRGSRTQLDAPLAIALDSAGTIYVLNEGSNDSPSITIYPLGSRGNAAPKAVLKGSKTGLQSPILSVLIPRATSTWRTRAHGLEARTKLLSLFQARSRFTHRAVPAMPAPRGSSPALRPA